MVTIPEYLDAPKNAVHAEQEAARGYCDGSCGDVVRANPATGRWFITMGHAGFNTSTNNDRGYASRRSAIAVERRLVRRSA